LQVAPKIVKKDMDLWFVSSEISKFAAMKQKKLWMIATIQKIVLTLQAHIL